MKKDDVIALYADVIIEDMQTRGFQVIDAEDNETDRIFYDFRNDAMILPITVLFEYVLEFDDETGNATGDVKDLDIIFTCFTNDDTSYFDNNFGSYFESERLTVFYDGYPYIKAEEVNTDKHFYFTFGLMETRTREIVKEIVEDLSSQEYFASHYRNFANDYHLLETFLKANGVTEEQLFEMYIRIDKLDKLPSSVTDVFLF